MSSFAKKITIFLVLALFTTCLTGCGSHTFAETEESLIVSAKELSDYMGKENVVLVDMQSPEDYGKEHLEGAVNITTDDIVINVPVKNMLTSKKKMERVMGEHGISNDTQVIAYGSDKNSASRLLWSLFMYGHENVKVVDGGFEAIKAAGLTTTAEVPSITEAVFTAGEPSSEWLVDSSRVLEQVNNPQDNVVLLDVRSEEEYYAEGKVPTSIMMDYVGNFFSDGTFKTTEITKINYLENEIYPEDEIIIYCKTSFRAAPVFVQLYEAGYRNIKLYDGAFLEWSSNSDNPIEMPEGAAAPSKKDAS